MSENWKAYIRTLVVALITSAVVLGVLIIGFSGKNAREEQVLVDTRNANLAIACIFVLPVNTSGVGPARDPQQVQACFTQYGLPAPRIPGLDGPDA